MDNGLAALYEQKKRKLEEQKAISDKMNNILTGDNGMNDNSRLACKNLIAAIAASQKPGYFAYHETSKELAEIESSGTLNKLARSVAKVGRELDNLNAEIEQASVFKKSNYIPEPSSFSQWMETYDEEFRKVGIGSTKSANAPEPKDMLSTFNASKKIYGGTAHHRSFKSLAATMKKGHCTR